MKTRNILIVAGEPSGDLHASNLIKDLKSLKTDLRFFGIGGALLKKAGFETVSDISGLALVGTVEVIKNISAVRKAFTSLISRIDSDRPDLAILVDYPGFNLRLAKELDKRSIPIVYYISPQVWAWGRNRIEIIKRYVKKIIVFFKFEEELYKRHGIDAEFIGHPILDIAKPSSAKEDILKKYGLSAEKTRIALLPGSRAQEIGYLLTPMAEGCRVINERLKNVQFILSKHPQLPSKLYEEAVGSITDIRVVEDDVYNILSASDLAIAASGTATLEAAVIGTPSIIVYKTNLITYLLAKALVKIPFIGLVNIIGGKEIFPELIQFDVTAEKIAGKTIRMLGDEARRNSIREDLKRVRSSLGTPGAGRRGARAILPLLE